MAALNVRDVGDFIRDQRRTAQISLRQLAKQAGVSNPYLSQIERGLRRPSAEILQQIAKALRISAEVLYVQAGILEERHGGENVMAAVLGDESLSERQKQVVLDIYEAFCKENAVAGRTGPDDVELAADVPADEEATVPVAPAVDEKASATAPARRRGTVRGTSTTADTRRTGTGRSAAAAGRAPGKPAASASPETAPTGTAPPKRRTKRTTATDTAASTGTSSAGEPTRSRRGGGSDVVADSGSTAGNANGVAGTEQPATGTT
ncbi:putative transcriptional regulator [Frankia canadensis]|uniref:Putative transcriptional regulator n=1 Tax=Frankia canadensis TaxID=1836972 RepID=A0A2I2KWK2_9ACTN|nr:putative transcriptional regulator [Frankia canadensis]SOU57329.1 putative transcriptional regulator [Frankia canadensis]